MMVALGLVMILARLAFAAGFFRTIFYLPDITPPVAIGILILALFNGSQGLVNKALGFIGIPGPFWTTDPNWIKPSLAITSIWASGGTMVIYLAALHGVPKQLYEAAAIDGASRARQFWRITVPLLRPTIIFTAIISTIGGLQLFTEPLLFGSGQMGGGSLGQFQTMTMYMFENAFRDYEYGYGAAIAWVLFVIIILVSIVNFLIIRRLRSTS
jgi:ABC-type sugar transport system permease subunit